MATSKEYPLGKESKLVIQKGDLTEWSGDAIVNAGSTVHVICLKQLFKPQSKGG